jgi:signal transduction histidine kinase
LGLPRAEVIGKDSVELGIWPDPVKRAAFWDDLKRDGVIRQREVTLHNQRGRVYTMLLSADIVQIRGEPHVLVNALDITARKQAEEELLSALAREKELVDLKSSFVSMVSHEFRTPLGVIMSSAEILQDYLEDLDPAERREHLQSIHKNTRRMAELMEEVLLLGRFDAGKMPFQPKLIDLRSFCQRVADEVLAAAECRNPITFHCDALPAEAHADERLLRHILLNVLTNALKYSECGQPIDFSIRAEDRDVVCRIVDRGIGIPEADREWLFHAFHRGRNVGQRPGTGLGLVIVKRCVDLHGGRIEIDSKPGEGTAVIIRLPVFPKP